MDETLMERAIRQANQRFDEIWAEEAASLRRPCRHCSRGLHDHCTFCGACAEGECSEQHRRETVFSPMDKQEQPK